ncbi:MAG: MmcQ/YjbR family DNA-binding protein, partial [Thermoguttaceae bacterium]|nr:MmcQ/YjbR family DNA-binding protein [Thermoguttaceae bacterium]
MDAAEFRQLALSLPETTESAPLGVPEFRVRTKAFASLGYPDGKRGTAKLTPREQAEYLTADPHHGFLAKGARGQRGWTVVHLAEANPEMLRA